MGQVTASSNVETISLTTAAVVFDSASCEMGWSDCVRVVGCLEGWPGTTVRRIDPDMSRSRHLAATRHSVLSPHPRTPGWYWTQLPRSSLVHPLAKPGPESFRPLLNRSAVGAEAPHRKACGAWANEGAADLRGEEIRHPRSPGGLVARHDGRCRVAVEIEAHGDECLLAGGARGGKHRTRSGQIDA